MASITIKDIYEITNRIEDKLDKMETRVNALEIWKAQILGQLAIIGGFVMFFGNLAMDFAKEKIFGTKG